MAQSKYKECVDMLLPLEDTLEVIGGKWKIKIILSIWNGNHRFREILNSIPKISSKVLANNLRDLEQNKLITRSVLEDAPATIHYELEGYSDTLVPILMGLIDWGKNHRKKLFSTEEV
jgi:Predicted transcriptional regulators